MSILEHWFQNSNFNKQPRQGRNGKYLNGVKGDIKQDLKEMSNIFSQLSDSCLSSKLCTHSLPKK